MARALYDAAVDPRADYEELEIRTADGANLRAKLVERVRPRATLVLAHAMFARKSAFRRLGDALVDYRTLAFDFRGHGDSSAPEEWGYDALVARDLPAVVESVRARWDEPVVIVGHSLGAHVALASQATGALSADAIVMLAGNVWIRALEPSTARWLAKEGIARGMLAIADRNGVFPARKMRMGSDDASKRYMHDLFRGVTEDAWRSDSGTDYLAAIGNVSIPVASVLGAADRIMCHPECGQRFARRCGGPLRTAIVPGGHVEVLRAHGEITNAVEWALTQARP
jgi:alpha-beta hydrolase superfamily lysophospholipase